MATKMKMGAREIFKLQTVGYVKQCHPIRHNASDARHDVTLLQTCVAELRKLPQDEEWSCDQVCDYKGYRDCASKTIGQLVAELNAKIADMRGYWNV